MAKKSTEPLYTALFKLYIAKAAEGCGRYAEIDSNIYAGLSILKPIQNTEPRNYIRGLQAVSDIWFAYGNYYKARLYLDSALAITSQKPSLIDSVSKSNLQISQAKILLEKGFYNEALEIVKIQEKYRVFRQNQKIEVTRKGEKRLIKLPKKEQKKRNADIASLITIKDDILLRRGEYRVFDTSITRHIGYVRKLAGKTSLPVRDLQVLYAQRHELKKEKKLSTKYYIKAYYGSKVKASEKKAMNVLENVIYTYYWQGDRHRARKYMRKYYTMLQLSYGKKNPLYVRYGLSDVHIAYMYSKFDKANKRLKKLSKNAINLPLIHPLRTKMLYYSQDLNIKSSNYDQALDSLNRYIDSKLKLYGSDAPEYHKAKLLLSAYYASFSGKFAEAQAIEDESWTKIVKPQLSPQNHEYITYLTQFATLYDLLDKYDLAIGQLTQACDTVNKYYGKENVDYVSATQRNAEEYIKKGDFAKGETIINEAVELMNKLSNTENAAAKTATYSTLAKLYTTIGKYDEAEKALRKARRSSKKIKGNAAVEQSRSGDELAEYYIKNGQYNEAQNLLDKSLYLKEKRFGSTNKELIVTLNQMAQLSIIKGNYTQADKSLKRSADLTIKIFSEKSIKYAEYLRIREDLYKRIGEYTKADDAAMQILAIQKEVLGTKHIDLAATLSDIALIKFHATKQPDIPITFLLNAIDIVTQNIGTQNPQFAQFNTNLAIIYIETGKYGKADSLLIVASNTWLKLFGKNNINIAENAYLQGIILYKNAKYKEAENQFTIARTIYKNVFNTKHPGYVKATSKLAHTYYINQNYKKSAKMMDEITKTNLQYTQKYFPSLSFNEKSKYWEMMKSDFEFYNSVAQKLSKSNSTYINKMYANAVATKALLLSSSIKVRERIMNSKDDQLISKYNDWISKKEYLTTVISLSNETLKQMGVNIAQLEKEIIQLEKDLSESSELFATNADKKSYQWKDIKNALKTNEYAVEIVRFRHFTNHFTDSSVYMAFIISKNSAKNPQLVILPNGKDMETKYLKYYRNSTKLKNEETNSYNQYWKPLKEKIKDSALVYMSVDGAYNQLNIEGLYSDSGYYAIDKNDFVLVSNTKDIAIHSTKEKQTNASRAVLCGNPTFYVSAQQTSTTSAERGADINIKKVKKSEVLASEQQRDFRSDENIAQLPGTEEEIKNLENYLSTKKWILKSFKNDAADEDSIKNIRSPKIFHIATHGFFKEDYSRDELEGLTSSEAEFTQNPLLRSGLLLKGAGDVLRSSSILDINSEKGVLTAYEAMNLNLDNTDLVVLSACETGLGEVQVGEGVFGLQRAFLVAGSNTVVMSLFKVNDEVTQKLMTRFYELWLKSDDKRKSFSDAKREIKKFHHEPVYWASFVMTGL
ncbi:MAG: CHAT domain-containing protein [Cytophagales bacterium]|nr:CHAT domain-containing protein [Cytophagales bacterium]